MTVIEAQTNTTDYILSTQWYTALDSPQDPANKLKETSFVASTNEIREMIRATHQEQWGGLWYELLQGALDYNDDSQGRPSIVIYTSVPPPRRTLDEFCKAYGNTVQADQIIRVEVRNFILDPKEGLKPSHIARMEHIQASEVKTLGEHGRGLSIASTAIVGGGLGESIDYCSRTQELGTWIGKGTMIEDTDDPSATPAFGLRWRKATDTRGMPETNETIIGVNRPAPELVEALASFPKNFLPANPHYRFARLQRSTDLILDNQLTVFGSEKRIQRRADTNFDTWELSEAGISPDITKETEPTRVEILPDAFREERKPFYVYVDGLRVKTPKKWAVPWSFWGFKNGNSEYKAGRSNDSVHLSGDPSELMARVLKKASYDVIAQVLKANIGKGNSTAEGSVPYYTFKHLDSIQKGHFLAAWDSLRADIGLAEQPIIVLDEISLPESGMYQGRPVLLLNSKAMVTALLEAVPGIQTLEAVMEEERMAAQALLRAERESREKILAAEKAKMQQEAAEERKRQGLLKEAQPTDEVIKVRQPEDPLVTMELTLQHLLHELAFNEGMIVADNNEGSITFALNPKRFLRIPQNANDDLGELSVVFRNFMATMGNAADIEIRVIKGDQTIFYKFDRLKKLDKAGNISLTIAAGELINKGNDLVQILLKPKQSDGDIKIPSAEEEYYHQFYGDLKAAVYSLLGADKRISYEAYKDSEFGQNYPALEARIRMRRDLDALLAKQEEMAKRLGYVVDLRNKQRHMLGQASDEPPELSALREIIAAERRSLQPPRPRGKDEEIDRGNVLSYLDRQVERVLHIQSPYGLRGLNRDAEEQSEPITRNQERLMREGLRRQLRPDVSLYSGLNDRMKIQGYLISHINPEFSETDKTPFTAIDLPRYQDPGRETVMPTMVMNHPIYSGTHALFHPPGFVPAGYYHPDKNVLLSFAYLEKGQMFAFTSKKQIPAGLTIYYERSSQVDTTPPDAVETAQLIRIEELSEGWRDLITLINEKKQAGTLTDKQIVDLLIRAWNHAFTYSNEQSVFDKYGDLQDVAFAEKIINIAEGDCGYAKRGFTGLCKAVGIPVREVASFLSGDGNFSLKKNTHGINQVWINGQWVLIEPQSGYMEDGFQLEKLPAPMKQQFRAILSKLPSKKFNYIESLGRLPQLSVRPSILAEQAGRFAKSVVNEGKSKWKEITGAIAVGSILGWVSTQIDFSQIFTPDEIPTVTPPTATPVSSWLEYDPVSPGIEIPLPDLNLDMLSLYLAQLHHAIASLPPQLAATGAILGLIGTVLQGYRIMNKKEQRYQRETERKLLEEWEKLNGQIENEIAAIKKLGVSI